MKATVRITVVLALALLQPQVPALAKQLPKGPVAVMTPRGKVFVLKGSEARAFVRDANSLQCNESCDSPDAAARVAEGPVSGATSERYLVAFNGWGGGARFNWTAAAWFYPSTEEESAYLVWPIGIGDGRGAWSEWQEATPRMERIIRRAMPQATAPLPFTGASSPATALIAGISFAGLGLLLVRISSKRRPVRSRSQRPQ